MSKHPSWKCNKCGNESEPKGNHIVCMGCNKIEVGCVCETKEKEGQP